MSSLKTILILGALLFFSAGCGRESDSGKAFVPGKGHPGAWASHVSIGTEDFHGTFIKTVAPAAAGATLFVFHCAPCHGNDGSGKIGPNIQSATLSLIDYAIQNIPVMEGHAGLSQSERQSIAGYLPSLAGEPQPLAGSFDTDLCKQCHGEKLDGGIAAVSCYGCHNGPDGSLGHSSVWSDGAMHGPYGRDFASGCTTCHGTDLKGGSVYLSGSAPSCSSCHTEVFAPALNRTQGG